MSAICRIFLKYHNSAIHRASARPAIDGGGWNKAPLCSASCLGPAGGHPSAPLMGCWGSPCPGCTQARPLGSNVDSGPPRWPGAGPGPGWPTERVQDRVRLPVNDGVPFPAAIPHSPGRVRPVTRPHTGSLRYSWVDR